VVHGKKVDDVRRWFMEALDGGKLRKYRVSTTIHSSHSVADGGISASSHSLGQRDLVRQPPSRCLQEN
jgi:hypothetical protein